MAFTTRACGCSITACLSVSNNAGKSTVIDAIRVFYEKDGFKHKPDRDFPFIPGADQESWGDQNKDEHGEVNQLIQETKTGLITAIAPVAGDMEAFLGIPKPKSDHRKPQHLLFLHETGQISAEQAQRLLRVRRRLSPTGKTGYKPADDDAVDDRE